MHTIPIGESFASIVLGHIKRFHFQSMVYINFCPCKNSLIETLFCTYYVRNKSSKLYTKRISAGLLIRVKCKYVES